MVHVASMRCPVYSRLQHVEEADLDLTDQEDEVYDSS